MRGDLTNQRAPGQEERMTGGTRTQYRPGMVPYFLLASGADLCGADRETGTYGTPCLSYQGVYL